MKVNIFTRDKSHDPPPSKEPEVINSSPKMSTNLGKKNSPTKPVWHDAKEHHPTTGERKAAPVPNSVMLLHNVATTAVTLDSGGNLKKYAELANGLRIDARVQTKTLDELDAHPLFRARFSEYRAYQYQYIPQPAGKETTRSFEYSFVCAVFFSYLEQLFTRTRFPKVTMAKDKFLSLFSLGNKAELVMGTEGVFTAYDTMHKEKKAEHAIDNFLYNCKVGDVRQQRNVCGFFAILMAMDKGKKKENGNEKEEEKEKKKEKEKEKESGLGIDMKARYDLARAAELAGRCAAVIGCNIAIYHNGELQHFEQVRKRGMYSFTINIMVKGETACCLYKCKEKRKATELGIPTEALFGLKDGDIGHDFFKLELPSHLLGMQKGLVDAKTRAEQDLARTVEDQKETLENVKDILRKLTGALSERAGFALYETPDEIELAMECLKQYTSLLKDEKEAAVKRKRKESKCDTKTNGVEASSETPRPSSPVPTITS